MASLELDKDKLTVRMHGLDKFWSWTSTLTIPLSHVTEVALVSADPVLHELGWFDKRVGTHWPGKFAMGTFNLGDDIVFLDLHHENAKAVQLTCTGEKVKKVIVELVDQDPNEWVGRLQSALRAK